MADKRFSHYSFLNSNKLPTPERKRKDGQQQTILFDDLSKTLGQKLTTLKPGEISSVYFTGNEMYSANINKREGKSEITSPLNRVRIVRSILTPKWRN